MKKPLLFLFSVMLFAFAACAHNPAEHVVDRKLATNSQVETSVQLSLKTEREIKNSTTLSEDQKSQLLDLNYKAFEELTRLQKESLQLRDLLIADFTEPLSSTNEIDVIKSRLEKVEQKRLVVMLNTIDQATSILGSKDPTNYRVLKNFGDFPSLIR